MIVSTSLGTIQQLIESGDTRQARRHLKKILKKEPSAQAWYLAALAIDDDMQKISCLREALKLDEFHSASNRLLYKIEGGVPLHEVEKQRLHEEKLKTREIKPLKKIERQMKQDRFQKHRARQRRRTRLGCVFSLMLSISCTMFSVSLIGLLPGFIGTVTILIGGPAPVYDIEGTPIEDREDALLVMTPAQSNEASNQEVDVMDHGYLHEYQFDARRGKNYAIYVQFMSLTANHVSRNVAIINESGFEVTGTCERESILEGDNGVAYICRANSSGVWSVRVLGINGESIGAYFIGVETLDF